MVQLAKTVKDVTIFGVCSKSKHEALKAAGTIDHLLERGTDYSNEVRKCVIKSMIYLFFFLLYSMFIRRRRSLSPLLLLCSAGSPRKVWISFWIAFAAKSATRVTLC